MLTIQKQETLKRAKVEYNRVYKQWEASGSLQLQGYTVDIPTTKHETLDEAVAALKEGMAQAVKDFDHLIAGEAQRSG